MKKYQVIVEIERELPPYQTLSRNRYLVGLFDDVNQAYEGANETIDAIIKIPKVHFDTFYKSYYDGCSYSYRHVCLSGPMNYKGKNNIVHYRIYIESINSGTIDDILAEFCLQAAEK